MHILRKAIHDHEDITLMMFSYTVNTIPPLSYITWSGN